MHGPVRALTADEQGLIQLLARFAHRGDSAAFMALEMGFDGQNHKYLSQDGPAQLLSALVIRESVGLATGAIRFPRLRPYRIESLALQLLDVCRVVF